jgi:hypothetical protein
MIMRAIRVQPEASAAEERDCPAGIVADTTLRLIARALILPRQIEIYHVVGGRRRIRRMAIRRKRQIVRKRAAMSGRQAVVDPFRPDPSKAKLREQAAEAVASYAGPITRCAPKRRKVP